MTAVPLTEAIYFVSESMLNLIIDSQENLDHLIKEGYTTLESAVHRGYVNEAKILLEKGANVKNPLMLAAI